MANDFLEKILVYKRELLAEKKAYYENLRKNIDSAKHTHYHVFKKAISRPGAMHLIAEVKKASPSRGIIREDFDALKIAKIYEKNQAAAISVLTEDKYFLGKSAYLKDISDAVRVPTLMKDFIIHEHQIYEASVCGASAVLLIVAILSNDELKHLMAAAHRLGLDCLVEVHDEQELERAIAVALTAANLRSRLETSSMTSACGGRCPQGVNMTMPRPPLKSEDWPKLPGTRIITRLAVPSSTKGRSCFSISIIWACAAS